MVMAICVKIRNMHYRLRNSTNTIAVLMVLFLTFIAAILYLNEQESYSAASAPMSPCITPVKYSPSISKAKDSVTSSPAANPPESFTTADSLTETPSPSPMKHLLDTPSVSPTAHLLEAPSPSPSIHQLPDSSPMPVAVQEPTPSPLPSVLSKPSPLPDTNPTAIPVAPALSPAITKPPQKTALRKVLIVVDPGHGGIDPGTCSIYQTNLYEKDINLDIALKLKTLLEDAQIPVLMTRESDVEVFQSNQYDNDENIRERPRIANRNQATLFISIHVNAYDTKLPGGERHHGTEIYHAGKTHGAFTSKQFAEIMGKAIDKKTETRYNGVLEKNFGVLRLSEMPALLIETAYLTNKEDHSRLESNEFRSVMAEGIYDGITEILKTMGAYKQNETWCILAKDA